MTRDPHHISSAIIHARPEAAAELCRRIPALMPGLEVPAAEGGKLVVTLETDSESEIVDRLNAISLMDGVLSVSLVYHHFEPPAETPDAALADPATKEGSSPCTGSRGETT